MRELYELNTLLAGLPALASGAPRLRALQLGLPMLDGSVNSLEIDLGPLWRGLGALSGLTSLALGWAPFGDKPSAHMGERIADVLDAAQVGSAATACAPV